MFIILTIVFIACISVAFGIWNCYEWISDEVDEAKEIAHKTMKPENDKQ
ncbi:hypothetical protein [Ferrovum sp.]|nr:hypothetical protein [Ferrovum sp.]